jgi:hypothetical protein
VSDDQSNEPPPKSICFVTFHEAMFYKYNTFGNTVKILMGNQTVRGNEL